MKKLIAILLTLSLIFACAAVLTACGNKTDNPADNNQQGGNENGGNEGGGNEGGGDNTEVGVDYTVTILDIFGNPIEGIKLKFTYGESETEVLTTGADGKATKKIDTYDDVIVEFVELGNYGNLTKTQRNLNGDTEKTLTLPTKATVTVVDEEGNPVEGVMVQICHSVCLTPSYTNAEGKVVAGISSTEQIKAAILTVPVGYGIPEAIGEYQGLDIHAYFEEGTYEVTITVITDTIG